METNVKNTVTRKLTREEIKQLNQVLDMNVRSFSQYHSFASQLWDASHLNELENLVENAKNAVNTATDADTKKELKKQLENVTKRYQNAVAISETNELKTAIEVFSIKLKKLAFEDLNIKFLKTWLPLNSRGQICDIKNIAIEDETSAMETYKDGNALNYELIRNADKGNLQLFKPVVNWTASKYIAKFTASITLRERAISQASQLEREKERAQNERKRFDAEIMHVLDYARKNGIDLSTVTSETAKQTA